MKNTVAIFILIGFFIQTFSGLVIFTDYLLNMESITNRFCENKSKPKLKCNGKCHLTKQLKEQEKKENQTNSNKKWVDVSLFYENAEIIISNLIVSCCCSNSVYLDRKTTIVNNSIFHPPAC